MTDVIFPIVVYLNDVCDLLSPSLASLFSPVLHASQEVEGGQGGEENAEA
jgi:hypothetical protein